MRYSYVRTRRLARARPGGVPPEARPRVTRLVAPRRAARAYAVLALAGAAFAFGSLGCSSQKDQVEEVAWRFVEAIEKQDVGTLDKIIDWERYYAYGKEDSGAAGRGSPEVDVEKEKDLLLSVLARDRELALNYLTAQNSIAKVSVDREEARVVVRQVDRATDEERTVTLLLHREENGEWKIYRFSTSSPDKDGG